MLFAEVSDKVPVTFESAIGFGLFVSVVFVMCGFSRWSLLLIPISILVILNVECHWLMGEQVTTRSFAEEMGKQYMRNLYLGLNLPPLATFVALSLCRLIKPKCQLLREILRG